MGGKVGVNSTKTTTTITRNTKMMVPPLRQLIRGLFFDDSWVDNPYYNMKKITTTKPTIVFIEDKVGVHKTHITFTIASRKPK